MFGGPTAGRAESSTDATPYRSTGCANGPRSKPTVVPIAFTVAPDGSTAVTDDQTVDSIQGERLARETVTHVYRFAGGRVSATEIRPHPSPLP
jgi:hypothetical protein